MPDNMMRCSVEPMLKITPGSIPGEGGTVKISFTATTTNLDALRVEYKILGPSAYVFEAHDMAAYTVQDKPTSAVIIRRVKSKATATKTYSSGDVKIKRQGANAGEASLKIVATVRGDLETSKLRMVRTIGSIAILSGGLRKLMKEHFGASFAAGGGAEFKKQAMQFVRAKQKELGSRFSGFASLTPETVFNAIKGETQHRADTIKKLDPVVKELAKGATDEIPKNQREPTTAEKPA